MSVESRERRRRSVLILFITLVVFRGKVLCEKSDIGARTSQWNSFIGILALVGKYYESILRILTQIRPGLFADNQNIWVDNVLL